MPIHHIAGPMRFGRVERQDKAIGFGTQFVNGLLRGSGDMLGGPAFQGRDTRPEWVWVGGMIYIPDGLLNLRVEVLEFTGTAFADIQEGVQETFDNDDQWEERPPSILGRLPAIRVDRLRLIPGIETLGFRLKTPIGFR